jgi:hypothetical protein
MLIRYQGGNFYDLIRDHKKFIWYVYSINHDEILEIKPSWYGVVNDRDRVNEINNEFPDIIFIESYINEVEDELLEIGLKLYDSIENGGWFHNEDKKVKPMILSFDKGWIVDDSNYKCYCMQTVIDMIFESYPEKLQDYLNQPV